MKNEEEDCYLDLKKLSAYSSLAASTLRAYTRIVDNPLPCYCVRRKILVKKSEFDKWIEGYRPNPKLERMEFDAIINKIKQKYRGPSTIRVRKKKPMPDAG